MMIGYPFPKTLNVQNKYKLLSKLNVQGIHVLDLKRTPIVMEKIIQNHYKQMQICYYLHFAVFGTLIFSAKRQTTTLKVQND